MVNSTVSCMVVATAILIVGTLPASAEQPRGGMPSAMSEGKEAPAGPSHSGSEGKQGSSARMDQTHSGGMGEQKSGGSDTDTHGMSSNPTQKRSGGTQGLQEQLYEDRMKGFQESSPSQGNRKP